jgi:SulP family sulfate permease
MAAVAVVFLGVPQGMAYATIANLPPAMGLWAAALPVIVGSLLRSSSHVVAGPTNALSLLVGAGVAAGIADDPVVGAVTLAAMVGVIQLAAGTLRLGMIVDYISSSVVLGYITGAGVLIGIGQLYNLTGTSGDRGRIWVTVGGWVETLGMTQPIALAMAGGTVVVILVLRKLVPRVPAAVVATAGAIIIEMVFGLHDKGLKIVRDIEPIPAGLPPLTMPDFTLLADLAPVAIACTVLSLIESNAVARSIAQQTGQKLDASVEFSGQGLSNLAAAFTGGYPVSGSLSRSALNHKAGAKSRLAGVYTGVMMIGVLLLLGPVLDHTPIAALAGLLMIVAYDLVDTKRIKSAWGAGWSDRLALIATVIGTWTLPLDTAIYLGVGVSLVLFLKRARLLTVREVVVGEEGEFMELGVRGVRERDGEPEHEYCRAVRILQVQGPLFFGAANELSVLLDEVTRDEHLVTLVVRLRRATGMDATVATMFTAQAERMRAHGQRLILVGVSQGERDVLEGTGAAEVIGAENIRSINPKWLSGLHGVLEEATEERCGAGMCERCPLRDWEPSKLKAR